MKKRHIRLAHTLPACSPSSRGIPLAVALTLCLILGSSLLMGCAVGAAVGLMGAATNAAPLVSSAMEPGSQDNEPEQVFAFVEDDTAVYAGPGEEYSQIATLSEGTEIQVLRQRGDWIECRCVHFRVGWVDQSVVTHK
jgi:hypothetical protein